MITCDMKDAPDSPCSGAITARYRENPGRPWGYRCAAHASALSERYVIIERISGTVRLGPVGDIEQLVADAESKLDDEQLPDDIVLRDLLLRLRLLAGLDATAYEQRFYRSMTIGRNDECKIVTSHDARLCGKPEAHR